MSELAFNVNGEPFEVPASAAGWRVRRLKQKGAPEVVYGRDGLPLVLPLEAEFEDLRREAGGPGRYRLDPIDETHKTIAGAPAGYVFVHAERNAEPAPHTISSVAPSDNIVIEAMRMNAEIAKSVVDRFPQMLEASAVLLRAADGAGLPARPPMAIVDDEEGEAEVESKPAGFDISAIVAQLVPLVMTALGSGKLPKLGEMLDWRKAASPTANAKKQLGPADLSPAPATTIEDEETWPGRHALQSPPAIDPATMVRFAAIQAALTPEESTLAREMAAELSPSELRTWLDELSKLAVPEAVTKIRGILHGTSAGAKGGVS